MQSRPGIASRPQGYLYVAVFLTLTAAIGIAGYRSYTEQSRVFEIELRRRLNDIADLKRSQILAWEAERVGDAEVARVAGPLIPAVQTMLTSDGTQDSRRQALQWADTIRTSYHYANVVLTDAHGNVRLNSGPLFGTAALYHDASTKTAATTGIFVNYYPPGDSVLKSHFVFGAPLKTQDVIWGFALLGVDPWILPLPDVLRWPSPQQAGEVIIARQEQNVVRILRASGESREIVANESNSMSSAVRAVLSKGGFADGFDEHGVAMVASARQVLYSWFVVPRMRADVAYGPLHNAMTLTALVGGLLIIMCGVGIGLIWRQQVATYYRQRYEAEAEHVALLGHYDYLTRFANDAIFLADGDGKILEANERATDIYGYSRAEFLKMNFRQLRAPEELAVFEATMESLKTQKSLVYETVAQRSGGTVFPVEVSIRMIEVDGGTRLQSIIRDITERRRTEAQIRRLNRLYAVLSRCGQALIEARTESELLDRVCRVAVEDGGFAAAYIGMIDPATDLIVPRARAGESARHLEDACMQAIGKPLGQTAVDFAVQNGGSVVCNDITTDPRIRHMREVSAKYGIRSAIGLPLRREGKVVGMLQFFSTEPNFFNDEEIKLASEIGGSVSYAVDKLEKDRQRRQAEAELTSSRELLELVLDATNEGYWDWDLATGQTRHSPRYAYMLGYQPGELDDGYAAWREGVHPEDIPGVEAYLQKLLASGQDAYSAEFRVRCKSGQYIWVLNRGKVVARTADGQPLRMVGTQTDITERKGLEDQFRQAQKLESVGRLAGGVAHDFNNLLTVISGYADLLIRRFPEGDPTRRQLDEIKEAGAQAASLTRQLLTFSRNQPNHAQLLHLNRVVAGSERMLRRLIREDIELVTRFQTSGDLVMADRNQLYQVLLNLVVNAGDAMPDGGRLIIETTDAPPETQGTKDSSERAGGSYVRLSVTDTGTGMDLATLQHIFEPFFTTKDTGKGTGLGLSMVYGIVRQCGGFVRVESEPGRGAAFHVYLPLAAGEAASDGDAAPGPANVRGSETVLVVEDKDNVRRLAVETLRSCGYSVLAARGGDEAMAISERRTDPIDLLLTDVVMPGMNGNKLAERLLRFRPEMKVIFMSGYPDDALGSPAAVSALHYLPKPFGPDELGLKVREVLGPSRPFGHTILVVDDDGGIRNLFLDILGRDNRVILASDGAEALEILRGSTAPDLVITDMVMPNSDGTETLRAVRKLCPRTKIIAMSGAFGGQFMKTMELLGANATLAKPVDPDQLLATVEALLGQPV